MDRLMDMLDVVRTQVSHMTQVVLIDCDNISPTFWRSIQPVLSSDRVLLGAGVVLAVKAWQRVLPIVAFDCVPPVANAADMRLSDLADAAFAQGARDFILCSSDRDLNATVKRLCAQGASVRRVRASQGVPMMISRIEGEFVRTPLLPPGMPRTVFEALVQYRALICLGAAHRWITLDSAYSTAKGLGYSLPLSAFQAGLHQLECVSFRKDQPTRPWMLFVQGRPRVRVPAGTTYA